MENLRLAVVSSDRQTLDGVQEYFERAGARLSTTASLDDVRLRTRNADVVIVFADGYPNDEARRAVTELSAKLVIVVTAEVDSFDSFGGASDVSRRCVVLPRPAWGWMLVEAIQSGLRPVAMKS